MIRHADSTRRIHIRHSSSRMEADNPAASTTLQEPSSVFGSPRTSSSLRLRYLRQEEEVVMRKCMALRRAHNTARVDRGRQAPCSTLQTCRVRTCRDSRNRSSTGSTDPTLCMESPRPASRLRSHPTTKYHATRNGLVPRPRHWRPSLAVRRPLSITLQDSLFPPVRRCQTWRHRICLRNIRAPTRRQAHLHPTPVR